MLVIVTIARTGHAEGHDYNALPRQRRGFIGLRRRRPHSAWPERSEGNALPRQRRGFIGLRRRRPVPAWPERSEGNLSGQPEFTPQVDFGIAAQLWTAGPLDGSGNQMIQQYLITNTSPQFTPASLSVSCVWTPVTGYGGGGGPRPDHIYGSGLAQIYLEETIVTWDFERLVAVYNLADHLPEDRQIPFTVSFEDTVGRLLSSDHITNVSFSFSFVDDPPAPQGGGQQPMGSSQGSGLFVQVDVPLNPQSNEMSAHVDALDPEQGGAGTPQITVNNNDPVAYDAGVNAAPAVIVNAAGEPSDTLEIAKMEHSLKADGSLVIDDDEDRFYVRVRNAGGHVQGSIVVSTIDNPDPAYNNPEVRMTLHPDGDDLVTESMILVADTVDDEYPGLNGEVGANNEDDDRSHLIQLEGSVLVSEVELGANVLPADVRATVEVEDTVTVNIVVFDVSGTTPEAVTAHFETIVSERFAQIGIKIEIEGAEEGVWDENEFGPHTPFYVRQESDDPSQVPPVEVPETVESIITDYQSENPNTINVFVVASLFAVDEDLSRIRRLRGVAFHRSIAWDYLDPQFRSCIFLARDIEGSFGFWTSSHELGHMTTDKVHYGTEYPQPTPPAHKIAHNLMQREFGKSQLITGPKRLYEVQKGNHHHQQQ